MLTDVLQLIYLYNNYLNTECQADIKKIS